MVYFQYECGIPVYFNEYRKWYTKETHSNIWLKYAFDCADACFNILEIVGHYTQTLQDSNIRWSKTLQKYLDF